MSLRLICSRGSWLLPEGETLFGRGTSCGICVLDARLSRRHAGFQLQGHKLTVIDLGSTNGVLVNGRPIIQRAEVRHGDQVAVGPCLLSIHIDDAPTPAAVINVDTEAINQRRQSEAPTAAAPHPGSSDPDRQINQLIAAAIAPPVAGSDKKGTDVHEPSEFREPGTEAVTAHGKQALQAPVLTSEERAAFLAVAHNSATTVHDELMPTASGQIASAVEASTSIRPGVRLAAGLLDAAQTTLVSLLIAIPIMIFGYAGALRQADAVLHDGLPRLAASREPPAAFAALAGSLLHDGGVAHACQMVGQLQSHFIRAPFVTLYLAVTLSVLVFLLTHVISTVVATVLYGGPFWHRRLGLTIVAVATNAPPSWGLGLRRWSLLLLLWPLAPFSVWRGKDGLHDRWSGCAVRKA